MWFQTSKQSVRSFLGQNKTKAFWHSGGEKQRGALHIDTTRLTSLSQVHRVGGFSQWYFMISYGFANAACTMCIVVFVWWFHEYDSQYTGQFSTSCLSKEQPSFLLSERLEAFSLGVATSKLVSDWLWTSTKFGMYRIGWNKLERSCSKTYTCICTCDARLARRNAPDFSFKTRGNACLSFIKYKLVKYK